MVTSKCFVTSNVYLKNILDVSPTFCAFKMIVANVSTPWKINTTLGAFNTVLFTVIQILKIYLKSEHLYKHIKVLILKNLK